MPNTKDTRRITFTKGPLIVNLEPIFVHGQRYPKRRTAPGRPPLSETASPQEIDGDFRTGHGRAFRIPLTRRAIVLGYWEPGQGAVLPEEESEHILKALHGAMIPGVTATEIATWSRGATLLSWYDRLKEKLLHFLRAYGILEQPARVARGSGEPASHQITKWDPAWLAEHVVIPEGDPVIDLMNLQGTPTPPTVEPPPAEDFYDGVEFRGRW